MTIRFRIENVTVTKAESYLSGMLPNRKAKRSAIARFAHDMEQGRWHLAQPLLFDSHQRLMDGRNRLMAVIRAGVTVPFCILEGFPAEIQIDIDSGTSRKAADNLQIAGQKNAVLLAATTRLVMVSKDIGWGYPVNVASLHASITTRSEEYEEAMANETIRRCVAHASEHRRVSRMLKSGSGLAWFLYANEMIGYGALALAFVDMLSRGAAPDKSPGDLFQRRLSSGDPRDRRILPRERMALFVKAWNAHVTGSDMKILRIDFNEAFPVLVGLGF